MPRFIEPLIFRNVDKENSPGGLDYAGRKILNPLRDILNIRYLSNENGEEGQGESIKGTSLFDDVYDSSPTATGRYKCVGSLEDQQTGKIISFFYNTDGYHRIIIYNPETDTASVIVNDAFGSPILNFQDNPKYLITGVAIIGDILMWTDNNGVQGYLNITRSYGTLNEFKLSLLKIGPRNKPVFTDKTSDSAQLVNRISDNSFQFAFRYLYLDNEISVLSPYSKLLLADAKGIDTTFTSTRNRALISHTIDAEVMPLLKRVELLFRVGNSPNWRVWKKIESASITSTINEYFYNTSPGESVAVNDSSKLFDLIPNKSKALSIFRNRVFLNINEEGITVPSATISAVRSAFAFSTAADLDPYIKKNGTYGVGLVEYDKYGRATGVIAKTFVSGEELRALPVNFFRSGSPLQEDTYNTKAYRINATIGGSGIPSGRYSIALTPELQYESYFQAPVRVLWYLREKGSVPAVAASEQFEYSGKIFRDKAFYAKTASDYSYLYLRLPSNVPFTPDGTYFVKVLNNPSITKIEKVIDVFEGDMLIVGNFGVTNWSVSPFFTEEFFIEVFKLKNEQNLFYHEVAGPFNIDSNGVLSTTVVNGIQGDTYYRGANIYYSPFNDDRRACQVRSLPIEFVVGASERTLKLIQFEQPTPIFTKPSGISKTAQLRPNSNNTDYTPDYSKSAWSQGRTFVELSSQVLNRPSTIRFSDPYIEGSQINGLNSFPAENEYNKIGEDASPITKLIPVADVLVAVHERNITTLYVGEGMVKTGDTGFLSKTDDVIGDDRKLLGNYGSYHPESVQEAEGLLFGWDIFNGVVWRRTVEGVYPISKDGMKGFFRDKAAAYLPYKDTIAFVAGVDKYHKEYLLTLPNVWASKQTDSTALSDSPSSQNYDIVINPASYVVGEVYQMVIKAHKTGASADDTISFSVLQDAVTNIDTGSVSYLVRASTLGAATAVTMEFVYTGATSMRIQFTGIGTAITVTSVISERSIKGETWAYNYESKAWSHRYNFVPDYFARSGNKLYSYKFGRLYKHNDSATYNNYYGHQYKSSFTFACNPQPNKVKVWSAVQIAANSLSTSDTSTTKVFEAENEFGQETYARAKEFDKKEGVYYGPILKDVNTNPALLSGSQIALRSGKDMRSKSLEVTVTNDSTERILVQKVNIIGETSEFSI